MRARRLVGHAIGGTVTVVAFVGGVAIGDGGDGDARRAATTVAASTSAPTTARSSAPTTARSSLPTTAAPEPPGPPVTVTTVEQVVFPADVAALRAILDQFGFPDWWPLPDSVTPFVSRLPVVQAIHATDSVSDPGTTAAFESSSRTTAWLVDTPDVAGAEALFVPKLPEELDVATGVAEKTTTVTDGITEVAYVFSEPAASPYGGLQMTIIDAFAGEPAERVGTLVRLVDGGPPPRVRPPPVPTSDAPAKQFLGQAPASPAMEWYETRFTASGGLFDDFVSRPSASFQASWNVATDDFDAVIDFLSDPAHFRGDLDVLATGSFASDERWSQAVGYQGLVGEYSMLRPEPGALAGYLYLEFRLPER